jgi:RNA polymerase sigma factor (sigma-70 family)
MAMASPLPALPARPEATFELSGALRVQLLRRARHLCRGKFDPEDLVQEVLTSNLRWLGGEEAHLPGAVEARLFRSLRNAFISRLRHAEARDRYARGLPADEPSVPAPADEPEVALWESVTREELAAAMRCLSQRQRDAFLAVTSGKRYSAIGAHLGISAGAVGKRVFDARHRLRKRLLEIIARRRS